MVTKSRFRADRTGGEGIRIVRGDLREHVGRALDTMAFQLKQHGFAVRVIQPGGPSR